MVSFFFSDTISPWEGLLLYRKIITCESEFVIPRRIGTILFPGPFAQYFR